jgi:hypothetical protein
MMIPQAAILKPPRQVFRPLLTNRLLAGLGFSQAQISICAGGSVSELSGLTIWPKGLE